MKNKQIGTKLEKTRHNHRSVGRLKKHLLMMTWNKLRNILLQIKKVYSLEKNIKENLKQNITRKRKGKQKTAWNLECWNLQNNKNRFRVFNKKNNFKITKVNKEIKLNWNLLKSSKELRQFNWSIIIISLKQVRKIMKTVIRMSHAGDVLHNYPEYGSSCERCHNRML